jgi:ribosome-associated protein
VVAVSLKNLTDAQRARLMERLGTRIDSRGVLRVVADERRSQARNREAGIERLQALVAEALKVPKPRKKTKPSRAAKQQRLADKRKRGERKRDRRTVDPDD